MTKEQLIKKLETAFEKMPKNSGKLLLYTNINAYRILYERGCIRTRISDGSEYCLGAEVIKAPFLDDDTMFVLMAEKDIRFPKTQYLQLF